MLNKKIKLLTTSLLVFGALTACNVNKDNKTAMDRPMRTAYDYNRVGYYSYNNSPNAYGYAPKRVNDYYANEYRYSDMYGMRKVRDNRPSNYSYDRVGYYSYNYPNVNQYTNDMYGMRKVNVDRTKTDDNGNIKYSKINKRIHDNRNDADYNYYADRNYHGHLTYTNYGNRRADWTNYSTGDGKLAEKISKRVETITNVDRVSTVVYGNDILVAVKSNNANNGMMENKIRQAVEPYAKNRKVHVRVDETMYNKVRDINNNLRLGKVSNNINKNLDKMFDTLRTE